jgi:lipoprotein-releasing system ATP-binding protein
VDNQILRLENVKKTLVSKSEGEVITNTILPDISFEVKKGEFSSITGTSGSGKTTLLYLMGGLDKPTEGRIYLDGEEISSLKEEELAAMRNKKLGFIYQFHFLLPEFTALENVMMPMLARGRTSIPRARKKAKQLLDQLGLADKLSSKPNQLSGGQQQRVAIARALGNDPVLLLADEPTGNLDSRNSENIYDLFEKLNRENKQTIIVVTHDEHFASKTHRIIHLVDGKIDHDSYL